MKMAFSITEIEAFENALYIESFLENAVLQLSCGGGESMYLALWGSRGGILLTLFGIVLLTFVCLL